MEKFNVNLPTIKDVKDFVNLVNEFPNEVKVSSGNYIVDGKSILGLLSLDLSKSVTVEVVGVVDGKNFKLKELLDLMG